MSKTKHEPKGPEAVADIIKAQGGVAQWEFSFFDANRRVLAQALREGPIISFDMSSKEFAELLLAL